MTTRSTEEAPVEPSVGGTTAFLWISQEWKQRKNITHDFSEANRSNHVMKTTLDVSWSYIRFYYASDSERQKIPIPVEWRPKEIVAEIDAKCDGRSAHIPPKVIHQQIARMILEPKLYNTADFSSFNFYTPSAPPLDIWPSVCLTDGLDYLISLSHEELAVCDTR